MCLYYYYCSLCAKKAFEMSGAVFGNHVLGRTSSRCNVSAVSNKPTFHLFIQKKAAEWAELQIPLLNYLRYQVCILVTKCKNIYSGSYFPFFPVLLLQVCCVCFAAADSGLSLVLCTSSQCFRQQAAHKPQRPCASIPQVRSLQGLNAPRVQVWGLARWILKSFDLSQTVTVAGRTALVNEADWRVLSQPEQRTSLKASFFFFF